MRARMPFALFLCAVVLGGAVPAVRADEDETAEESAKPSIAADAALNKGYQADKAESGTTGDGQTSGPAAAPLPKTGQSSSGVGRSPASFSQRPGASSGGDAGPGGGAGISCAKSVPKLRNVQRHEIDSKAMFGGDVIRWAMGPNEAVSYRFKTPGAGTAAINTNRDTSARSVPHLMTISETPCDFDVDKAMKPGAGPNSCYAWAPVSGGVVILIAPSKAKGCVLKPDSHYYFNIRFLSNPGGGEPRDSCEDDLPIFKSQNLTPRCGGIWHAVGNISW